MLRCAMAIADRLCGLGGGGVAVSVHIKIKHTVTLYMAPYEINLEYAFSKEASNVSLSNSEYLTLEQCPATVVLQYI